MRDGWLHGLPTALPARLGRYELTRLLGKGGMGAVYLATDTQLGRPVALKLPQLLGPTAEAIRDRFAREARLASTLSHPNLCPVYDSGTIDGIDYLAMAYLEGRPLSQVLRGARRLPPRAVVAVVRVLALAMAEAHAKGVLHRDLKPSNVMITPDKRPVVMDFGLARRFDADDSRLTASGAMLGTPAYMSPEQINCDAKRIGPGCDIYALGVILYECLTGHTPFAGPLGVLMAQAMTQQPPPLGKFRDDLDPALDAICQRALEKLPFDRYPTMKAFATALEDWLRTPAKRVEPPPAAAPPNKNAGVATQTDTHIGENAITLFNEMAHQQALYGGPTTPRSPGPRRRRKRPRRRFAPDALVPVAAGVAAIVLVGLMAGAAARYWPDPKPTLAPAAGADASAREQQVRDEEAARECATLRDDLEKFRAIRAGEEERARLKQWGAEPVERLAQLPADLKLAFGRHLVLNEADWYRGLRLLAECDHPAWREPAALDLHMTKADAPPQCLRCGDAWWALQETTTERPLRRLRERAEMWYRLAHGRGITESEADRVRRRLEQLRQP